VSHKQALESLWQGRCSVFVRQERRNPVSKRVEFDEVAVYADQPCRLSYKTVRQTTESNNAAETTQVTTLFVSNALLVPAGSKIAVTQNGRTTNYERSGEPAVYTHHQEITLTLFRGWA